MFNYEWKSVFKDAYLGVQHALNARWVNDITAENNKRAVTELKKVCEDYLKFGVEEGRRRGNAGQDKSDGGSD